MASPLWTVLLSTLLWAQTYGVLDETRLAGLMTNLLNVYRPTNLVEWYDRVHGAKCSDTPTFTLAVSVPYNKETGFYNWTQVTAVDSGEDVRTTLDRCQVYEGKRVIGATVLKWPSVKNLCPNETIPADWTDVRKACPDAKIWAELDEQCTNSINSKIAMRNIESENGLVDHAEYRVLGRFNHFLNRLKNKQLNKEDLKNEPLNEQDLMVFYSYKTPCDRRCASTKHTFSILQALTGINKWPNHALVFSKIFVPGKTSLSQEQLKKNRRTALTNLGKYIGKDNIYRCCLGASRCTRCGIKAGVSDTCVSDDTPNGK